MSKPAPVTPSRADYVVVGSGSAGSIVARRLAESGASVVLLEAGGPDRTQLVRKPGLIAVFHNIPQLKKRLAWEYYTIPQKNAHERTIPQTKGRVLGGSSSINGMLFVRGNQKNYDDWAAEGCKGWGFDDVLPSFKRLETWEDGETELRGGSGPVKVTRQTDLTPASQKFLSALQETTGLPMLDDYNGPSQEGVGVFQQSAAEGLRYSSSVAYLDDPLPSLYVETGATVSRVVIENGRATGVEYLTEEGRRTIHADREVVLSAGVFGSAQILMLSGVGPADHVRGHGIHVHADLPVGDNLHDHMFVPMTYVTKDAVHRGTTPHFVAGVAREYTRGGSWLARTVFEAAGFVRSSQASDIPDLQIHALPWSYPFPNQDAPTRHKVDKRPALTIMPTLIYPQSRGSVRLASSDPLQHPLIDPAYLVGEGGLRPAARGDRAGAGGDGALLDQGRHRPRAVARRRLLRRRRDGRRAAEPRDHRLPPRRDVPHGRRRAGGRRPGAAGARHRRAARRGHRDHAVDHRWQHQRTGDDDRRALCRADTSRCLVPRLLSTSLETDARRSPAPSSRSLVARAASDWPRRRR